MPNWYRIHGKELGAKKILLLFTLLVYVIQTPNLLLREVIRPDEENVHISSLYKCEWYQEFIWLDHIFSEICGSAPVFLVVIFNVASSGGLIRRLQNRKHKTQPGISDNPDNQATQTNSRAANDIKISALLFVLAIFYVTLVGTGNGLWEYKHYYGDHRDPENFLLDSLLVLVNNSLFALNGTINGFFLLIFPHMRKSLRRGLKKIILRLQKIMVTLNFK